MHFTYEEVEGLAAMAWCVKIQTNSSAVTVLHGSGIDCREDFFYEGCWNGDLTGTAFLSANICAASGAVIQDDKLLIVSPSNTLARLYGIRNERGLFISNSMAFLVVAAGETIDPSYMYYQEDISSIIAGLKHAAKSIPLQGGARITFYFHCNIEVKKTLDIEVYDKNPCLPFSNFLEYRRFLSKGLADLVKNANAPSRSVKFSPLVSISRGYDSVTCAVLAKEIGCLDAITMFDPESETPDADNGAHLASILGLNVSEFSRVQYKESALESEFFAIGTGGEDIFFAAMEDLLAGKMFISGFHGDKVWDKNSKKISDQIIRGDPSGADLEEFRLRVGFIHVAIPFFGCRAHSSINSISRGVELNEWSIGGDYDRPICRRIAEEAGLDRLSFGQKKKVMSRSYWNDGLEWYFGEQSLQEFREYVSRNPKSVKKTDIVLHWLAQVTDKISSSASRFSYRLGNLIAKIAGPLRRYQRPIDETKQLFHWSFEKMVQRYRSALVRNQQF